MESRTSVTRLLLGACLAVLAIAVPALTFAPGERQARPLRTVHRTLSRQNCDQEFGAHVQAPGGRTVAYIVRPHADAGNDRDDAPPAIIPSVVPAPPADAVTGRLTPHASPRPLALLVAGHSGRAPPPLA